MEDLYNIRRLALVLAIQAEIEGMKAENIFQERMNKTPKYRYDDFINKAEELRSMAYAHNEQL